MKDINGIEIKIGDYMLYDSGSESSNVGRDLAIIIGKNKEGNPICKNPKFSWTSSFSIFSHPEIISEESAKSYIDKAILYILER